MIEEEWIFRSALVCYREGEDVPKIRSVVKVMMIRVIVSMPMNQARWRTW